MKPLLALLLTAVTALAARHVVSWPVVEPQVNVSFRVVKWNGTTPITLGETTGTSLTVDLVAGDKVSVIAFNDYFGEALPSPPIEIPADPSTPSGRIFAVTFQASTDTETWQNVTILLPEEMTNNGQAGPRLFIRQKKP